ncbi:hypothetical protein A6R68_03192 [Neotoma lepida]|uniref:Peptidase M20 dimerisation domain-containing protein n=1 Tax=Neotoma lepida TaxID=56216 RepID=A0A1A6GRG6_NEOLE|nr:hypothetical protein A6R68_03192 [Neotoma lepida]
MPDGQSLPIPPIILAELGNDPKKPTVCFYGHLDVQPAQKDDGWLTDPYTLTEVDGKLYGRGATDNKGPVLAWINTVSAFRALEQDLPVNIKFILEGMEEAGSVSLEGLVQREKDRFFSSVDYIVISDNLWISRRKPALTYGTRGNCYFMVEVLASSTCGEIGAVKCRDQDFHSGTFGGILNEPMADLVALLGSLVDSSGHILIPGIYDEMAPLTEEEKALYENIDLDLEEHRKSSQVEKFLFDTKVKQHLEVVFSKRNSSNKMAVSMVLGLHPWTANIDDTQYLAAKRAIKTVFGVDPDMIQDGSTIPIAKLFQAITQKSVMMLPLGAVDDGEHSQNEKINRWNYIQGSKLFAAFFLELSKQHSDNRGQSSRFSAVRGQSELSESLQVFHPTLSHVATPAWLQCGILKESVIKVNYIYREIRGSLGSTHGRPHSGVVGLSFISLSGVTLCVAQPSNENTVRSEPTR